MSKQKKRKLRFPLWAKALLVLFSSVAIVSGVAIGFFSNSIRQTTRNFYIEEAVKTADTLGIYLDLNNVKAVKNKVEEIYKSIPEEEKYDNTHWDEPEWNEYLDKYNEVVEMPEFESLMDQIKKFHAKTEVRYTYLGYADLENARLVYLVDDAPEDECCRPGSFDKFTKSDMTVYNHLEEGFTPEITNMPEYGYLVSTGRPIYDGDELVAFAICDLSMDAIIAKENQNTQLLFIILISLSVVTVVGGFLLVYFLIASPLRKLTNVANEYVEGGNTELSKFAQVKINTKDELEDLSNSMKKMEGDIKHYINNMLGAEKRASEMKTLADIDAMTKLSNKRAYFELEERINEEIKLGKARFAITMIDVNDLKLTNDTLGHEKGDELIIYVANQIKATFLNSDIFRIGGDEFVVVSENSDYGNVKNLEKSFMDLMSSTENRSAAIGVAIYDKSKDNNVEDVFKRADRRMYEVKKKMKGKE